jgi:hypothetical protein
MFTFLENLEPILQAFWYVAIPASIVFSIQTLFTLIGLSSNIDLDGIDHAGSDFQPFSLRNMINFLLGFSWTGISFYQAITYKPLLILLALVVGLLFVLAFFYLIRMIQKLGEDNSFTYESTIGKSAEVYLTLPGNRGGKGKVLVSVNGTVHELEAMTDGNTLASGTKGTVAYIESNILIIQ